MVTVYYYNEPTGEVSTTLPDGELYFYSDLTELEVDCRELYGDAYELFEVTDENWRELYEAGAFDGQ